MRKFIALLVILFATSALAADFQYIVTYDFSKDTPCATSSSTLCIQDIIVYDTITGTRRVDVTLTAPPTATTSTDLTSSIVTLKNTYGNVTFYAVARGRDASGALVESNPTSAPSVLAVPGAVTRISVSVK